MNGGERRPSWVADTLGNRPFVVGAIYISCFFFPLMLVVGVPLAFIFRREPCEEWEMTHYRYLIRTFWLVLGWVALVAVLALLALWALGGNNDAGIPLLMVTVVVGLVIVAQFGVRSVLSMARAVARQPMPRPETLSF